MENTHSHAYTHRSTQRNLYSPPKTIKNQKKGGMNSPWGLDFGFDEDKKKVV